MDYLWLHKIVEDALIEDIGSGDITTQAILSEKAVATGKYYVKEPSVIAGLDAAKIAMQYFNKSEFTSFVKDGDKVKPGTCIAEVTGCAKSMLSAERVSLNLLQRSSGIATATRTAVEIAGKYGVKITDTRKTTPGLRAFEKYAVRAGGGTNHRNGLDSGCLIKENHIYMAGGVREAIRLARPNISHTLKIEIEVETVEDASIAAEENADIILLDNMDIKTLKQAVKVISKRAITEASGGIDLNNLEQIASTGIDYISMGSLTHSVKAVDISFIIKPD